MRRAALSMQYRLERRMKAYVFNVLLKTSGPGRHAGTGLAYCKYCADSVKQFTKLKTKILRALERLKRGKRRQFLWALALFVKCGF